MICLREIKLLNRNMRNEYQQIKGDTYRKEMAIKSAIKLGLSFTVPDHEYIFQMIYLLYRKPTIFKCAIKNIYTLFTPSKGDCNCYNSGLNFIVF